MASPTDDRTRIARVTLVVVAAVLFVLLRAPYVSVPLERDEGEYAYIAQRLLAGDVPYRDAFDQKPPGVFLVYALTFATLGTSIEAIHGVLYLWSALTCLAVYAVTRRLAGGLAAGAAALVFAIVSADPRLVATAANTEQFMLLPLVASLWFLLRGLEEHRARDWLWCGALVAAACWLKQVAVTHAAFTGIAVCLAGGAPPRVLRALSLLAVGALAISLPIAVFFALHGAWEPFLDAVLWHNLAYGGSQSLAQGWVNLQLTLSRIAPSTAAFALLALPALVWPLAGRRSWALLAGFALASVLGLSLGLYFRPHYFVQALPALAALCGCSVAAILERLPQRRQLVALAAFLLVAMAPPLVANRGFLFAGSPDVLSRRIYGNNPFPESVAIAKHIRSTSGEDETVFIVGSEPQILFYAGRRSATRYIFFYPLTAPFPRAGDRQREALAEVRAQPPRYIVWVNLPTSLLIREGTDPHIFKATRELIAADYDLEFVASPARDREEFEFRYGPDGERLLTSGGPRIFEASWVAVYRRRS